MVSVQAVARNHHEDPPEPFIPDDFNVFKLASMPSRNPVLSTRSESRLDVFHESVWGDGSSAWWRSWEQALVEHADGTVRLPVALMRHDSPEVILEKLLHGQKRVTMLRVVALLLSFRTLSVQQLAALSGERVDKVINLMWVLGLVDLGAYPSPMQSRMPISARGLVRLSRGSAFRKLVRPRITWVEWVQVTASLPWDVASQYDRHNLLAAELGLRVGEFCDVDTVLGERFTSMQDLVGDAYDGEAATASRRGDLGVLREDGLKIVVEMTAGRSWSLDKKAARWAEVLSRRSLEEQGLFVLFVVAADPRGRGERKPSRVRRGVHSSVAAAVRKHPGAPSARTALRMGVVSWEDWFPSPGLLSDRFPTMQVARSTGWDADRLWQPVELLGRRQMGFDALDPAGARALGLNARHLLGQPWWLRREPVDELWPLMMTGRYKTFPDPERVRPDGNSAVPLGSGYGVSGPVRAPIRFRTWPDRWDERRH